MNAHQNELTRYLIILGVCIIFFFARFSAAPNPLFKTMATDCEAWLNANPLGKLSLPVYSVWTFDAEVAQ